MSRVGGSTVTVLADSTVGLILLGCGLFARRSRTGRRVGLIMIAAAGCWFLGTFVAPFLFLHRGPLVHLHISYPTGRLRRPIATITVMIAYAVSLLEAVVRTPWLTLGLAVLVAAAAVDVFARTSGRARKAGWPALIAALTFAAVLAFSCANLLLGWEADRLVLFVYDTTIAALALILTADLRSGRWTDATLSDLVTQLGGGTGTGGLRGSCSKRWAIRPLWSATGCRTRRSTSTNAAYPWPCPMPRTVGRRRRSPTAASRLPYLSTTTRFWTTTSSWMGSVQLSTSPSRMRGCVPRCKPE